MGSKGGGVSKSCRQRRKPSLRHNRLLAGSTLCPLPPPGVGGVCLKKDPGCGLGRERREGSEDLMRFSSSEPARASRAMSSLHIPPPTQDTTGEADSSVGANLSVMGGRPSGSASVPLCICLYSEKQGGRSSRTGREFSIRGGQIWKTGGGPRAGKATDRRGADKNTTNQHVLPRRCKRRCEGASRSFVGSLTGKTRSCSRATSTLGTGRVG